MMENQRKKWQSHAPETADSGQPATPPVPALTCAVVTAVNNSRCMTVEVCRRGQAQALEAFVAASCLLRPEIGDVVLICPAALDAAGRNTAGGWWMLAVLRRAQEGLATLQVPGADAVALRAASLQLQGDERLTLHSADLSVDAQRASLRSGLLQLTAGTVGAVAKQLTLVADKLDTLARDVLLRCRNRVSKIDEVDALQSGQLSIQVEETLIAEGAQVVINARDNVRIDGKRILMG